MILCGGQGTRIRDADWNLPKALVPIHGKPILWHIMTHYQKYGLNEFILCVGYKAQEIQKYFSGNSHNFNIIYSDAGESAMTGARIKYAEDLIGADPDFCLTYGDGVSDINLNQLLSFHRAHGKILSITGVSPPSRFGELVFDQDLNITNFNEKPILTQRKISGGFFICRREIFQYLEPKNLNLVFEKSSMSRLVQDQQVKIFIHEGFWAAMDTYRDFLELNSVEIYKSFFK